MLVKVVVIDGQGGGVGRTIVEQVKGRFPKLSVMAVGTNALATAAMLRAGADAGASGENAVKVNAKDADVILGPVGIVVADALLGEVSPAMAAAVGASAAVKILIPIGKCHVQVAGIKDITLSSAVENAVELLINALNDADSRRYEEKPWK